MSDKRLYLIDATAFCYRAFFAIRSLSTSFGQPTNAVYGFINMLNKLLKEKNPQYLAVCFDVSKDTFRQKKFADYKIQRPPMPQGLSGQLPIIKEIISAYNIAIFEKEGYEADDIIGSLAKKAKGLGLQVTIVTSDKDMLQLVDSDTLVFSPYKDEGAIYDAKRVFERFGVAPSDIPDIIALMGDDVDNIPGAKGIGEKTAVELIKRFGSLDKLLAGVDNITPEKLKNTIKANIDNIKLSKELALLNKDVDLAIDLNKLKIGEPNFKELFRLFKYLEFNKLLKDLQPQDPPGGAAIKVNLFKDSKLQGLLGPGDELFLYGENLKDMVFYAQGSFFAVDKPKDNLRNLLADSNVNKISHDLKRIKIALAKDDIILKGLSFDTMLAGYLLNPSKPEYNLNSLAWDYLEKAFTAQQIDPESALNLIVQLKPKLERQLQAKALFNLFKDIEMPVAEVLARMELNGIKLDLKVLRALSNNIEERLIRLIEDIYALSGCQFNINSPKQLRDVLFVKLKLPVGKKSKTGPSTDEEVLKGLSKHHKLPALLLEYRQLTKLKNTYIDTLPDLIDPQSGLIHTSFNQTATETGRLSSTQPNLQNIPIKTDIGSKIRQAIVPLRENNYLLSCDYSQIELRVLAHISKDENLISAFKQGKDIHKATAALIYGLEEKDIDVVLRETAKRINFGIVYGLTAYGLSRDLNITIDEAERFIDAYFLRYPKVNLYIKEQIERAENQGFVTTILGRRRYIPEINSKNQAIRQFAQRKAVNTPIQGSASDLIKLAMINIQREIDKLNLASKMVLQIHDELVFDVPQEEAGQVVRLARDGMENVMSLDVPLRVSIKKGKNWLEMEEIK